MCSKYYNSRRRKICCWHSLWIFFPQSRLLFFVGIINNRCQRCFCGEKKTIRKYLYRLHYITVKIHLMCFKFIICNGSPVLCLTLKNQFHLSYFLCCQLSSHRMFRCISKWWKYLFAKSTDYILLVSTLRWSAGSDWITWYKTKYFDGP